MLTLAQKTFGKQLKSNTKPYTQYVTKEKEGKRKPKREESVLRKATTDKHGKNWHANNCILLTLSPERAFLWQYDQSIINTGWRRVYTFFVVEESHYYARYIVCTSTRECNLCQLPRCGLGILFQSHE